MTARNRAFGAGAAVLAAAIAMGCAKKDPRAGMPPEAVPVMVGTVAQKSVPLEVRAIGHVEAFSSVAVKARVGGQLTRVAFREGQTVKKGDLLFVIDPRPFQAALAEASANLARDRARAKNTEDDVKRYAVLIQKDYVTQQEYDLVRSNAAASAATVLADLAQIENARLNVEYCTVSAPITGRTGSLQIQAGNIVKANDDKPLVVINQIEPIYATFTVPESTLGQVQARMAGGNKLPVVASPSDRTAPPQTGALFFVDNAVDPQTGTILLKAQFDNRSQALWPGQFVDVVLGLSVDSNAIVVPTQAVQTGQSGQFVFVVKADSTVESRPITVTRTAGPDAIVSKGLQPGERVVTDGQLRLAPGTRVEIKSQEVRS
jgi:membrane fusion protein, multidrug efflux system